MVPVKEGMRVVPVSTASCPEGTDRVVGAPPADVLATVRALGARFPEARLREAPVARAPELDVRADPTGRTRIWLVLEALQVTGSFKVRGALVGLANRAKRGEQVIAASAGNHGVGVAYAANVMGARVTVVVPRTAPRTKKARIESLGAELVIAPSDSYDDAEDLAKELAASRGGSFLSPYDDEDVVLGNGASLGFEIVRALGGVPERVIAPFGGGGLTTGLGWAMAEESTQSPGPRIVWGAQSEQACAMAQSLEAGHAIERVPMQGATLAEGLEGGISARAFERARGAVAGVTVVSEEAIAQAMAYSYRDMGLVLEGSAAAALAPVLSGLPAQLCGGDMVVVLTGRNVDLERLEAVTSHRELRLTPVRSRN
jgi:threonine dehydratase